MFKVIDYNITLVTLLLSSVFVTFVNRLILNTIYNGKH